MNKVDKIKQEIYKCELDIDSYQNSIKSVQRQINKIKKECIYETENIKKLYNNICTEYEKIKGEYTTQLLDINNKKNNLNAELLKLGNKPKTITELKNRINNDKQKDILDRIMVGSENAKVYLSEYIANTDNKKKNLLGTIKLLGTFNYKKEKREEYEIKVFNEEEENTFWCNCPDHKFNSSKNDTCCKHISFIICKVLKYLEPQFFEDKKLPEYELAILLSKLTSEENLWKDKDLVKKIIKITIEIFKNYKKTIDEDEYCPVCYDELDNENKNDLLSCPNCNNYVHNECMDVWLENRNTCVYCKSDIWKEYKTIK